MSTMGDKKLNARDDKRAKAKEARGRRRSATGTFQLDLHGYAMLVALTDALARQGGALRIGFTRDMGALALGVYHEDDYATEYVRPSEDLWVATQEIAEAWLDDGSEALAAAITRLQLEIWISTR